MLNEIVKKELFINARLTALATASTLFSIQERKRVEKQRGPSYCVTSLLTAHTHIEGAVRSGENYNLGASYGKKVG